MTTSEAPALAEAPTGPMLTALFRSLCSPGMMESVNTVAEAVRLIMAAPKGMRLREVIGLDQLRRLHNASYASNSQSHAEAFGAFAQACAHLPARQRLLPFGGARRMWI